MAKPTNLKTLAGIAAGIIAGVCLSTAAQAGTQDAARMQSWRTAISHTAVPREGCFQAEYPLTVWREVKCGKAPNIAYLPRSGTGGSPDTVGNGNDYEAVTATLTQSAVGSFPKVKGLKSETGFGGRANTYTLQLNSNFMSNDPACAGAANPTACRGWEQFVYSSSEHSTFIQYWLINWGKACPGGWNTAGSGSSTSCWKNSLHAATTPQEVITDLDQMTLTGSAVAGGIDTITFVDGPNAYSITQDDSTMFLAAGWTGSEFNVIGDGGGSEANFNAGTKLTVRIDLTDGATVAPLCKAHSGTTGETNNLTLGACKAIKGKKNGALPAVQFTEALAKN